MSNIFAGIYFLKSTYPRLSLGVKALCSSVKNLSTLYIFMGWLALAVTGYFFTYQLFFTAMPIEKLADTQGGVQESFVYPGVVHFKGTRLSNGDSRRTRYIAPNIAEVGARHVEIFIHLSKVSSDRSYADIIGQLVVWQNSKGGQKLKYRLDLIDQEYQRLVLPWKPDGKTINNFIIAFEAIDAQEEISIVVATNVSVDLWSWIMFFLALSVLLLVVGWKKQADSIIMGSKLSYIIWSFVLFFLPVLLMYLFHSGFFISNALVENGQHGRVIGFHRQLHYLINDGYLSVRSYRSVAQVLVPGLVVMIEQTELVLSRLFAEIYPSFRYLVFVLTTGSFLILISVMRQAIGLRVSFIFFLLIASFFPFIVDLYAHDIDGYQIFLFPLLAAALIRILYDIGKVIWNYAALLIVLFCMVAVKISAGFLVVLIPIVLGLFYWKKGFYSFPRGGKAFLVSVTALLFIFFSVFTLGAKFSSAFNHPNSNVGIDGEPFQDTVFWHILWGASGTYDHDSAHGFTRSGRLRNDRVAEATGLETVTYLRQSQTATEIVYKPDILNALHERPGFFYATAFIRAYKDSINFFRYTLGMRDGNFGRFLGEGDYSDEELQLNRYGEGWKVAPLLMLAKFTQKDIGRLADWALLVFGFVGLFLLKSRPLLVFMLLVILAELAFTTSIHAINRYFMFCNIATLLGLSLFINRSFEIFFKVGAVKEQTRDDYV
jgi:hypothetical protein